MTESDWQQWLTEELRKGGIGYSVSLAGVARRLFHAISEIRQEEYFKGIEDGREEGLQAGFEIGFNEGMRGSW